jgi:hypothetical protein
VLFEWLRGPRRADELRLQDAALWTLNPRDFADIPRLRLAAVQRSVPGR